MSATPTHPAHPFGSLLRRHRQAAGLTQEELAERAGLSIEGISALERGVNRAPRKDTVELLAEALSLSATARAAFANAARTGAQPLTTPTAPADAASLPPLVGRTAELARLEHHLAGSGSPIWLLAGDPGIGKSRLLHEAARRAPILGWSVLEGGCHRRSGQEPYAPILGALERAIARRTPTQRRADLQGCAWLVRLLPELAELVAPPAPSWPLPPEQERRLMFAAVARFLANIAGPAGTLLILDDLHWAGPDAQDLLNALVRAPAGPPPRVAGAYRDSDLRPGDPLGALLADWAREGLAEQAHLTPLDGTASAQLLDSLLTGHATEHATASATVSTRAHVARLAGGVPFYLVSYAQALRTVPAPPDTTTMDAAQAVPWNVTQTIRQRLAVLRDDTRALVSVIAVMGHHAPLDLLLAAAGPLEPAALTALDEASRARLLVDDGEQGYRIAHDLIRDVVISDLGSARRATLHGHIAAALEQRPAPAPAPLLAYHWARAGESVRATVYLERSGDRAMDVHAAADAAGYYGELIERLEALDHGLEAAHAREKLAGALRTLARYDAALESLERAAVAYADAGATEDVARVTAHIGQIHSDRGSAAEGITRLRPLLAALESVGVSAAALAELHDALAQLLHITARYDEQLAASERAAALAREVGDGRLLAQVEMRRGNALRMLGRMHEAAPVLEEAVRLVETAGDSRTLAHALDNLSMVSLFRGELARAAAESQRALALAEEIGDPLMIGLMVFRLGMDRFALGAWDAARDDFARAADIVRQVGASWLTPYAATGRGLLALAEGRMDATAALLGEATALAGRSGDLQALRWAESALAERDLLAGNPTAARDRLAPLLDRGGQREGLVTYLLPLAAWAALDSGDPAEAEALVRACIARATSGDLRLALPDALRARALVALRAGRADEAAAALDEALAICRSLPYPYAEARALYTYGLTELQRGAPQRARERLNLAHAICARLGERLYATRIEQTLDEAPATPVAPRPRDDRTSRR